MAKVGENHEGSAHSAGAPTVSIALCTYNGERYLEEQLRSIAAQSRLPDELVVCDDASSDRTLEIVAEFRSRVSFSVILRKNEQNLGYTGNFASALAAVSGDIVFLSDQDDIWHETKIERYLAAFASDPSALLAYGDSRLVDSSGVPLGRTLWQLLGFQPADSHALGTREGFDLVLKRGNLYCGCSMAVKRALIAEATPLPKGMPHDLWLGMLASGLGAVQLISEPLLDYRQHAAQTSGAKRPGLFSRVRRMFGSLKYYAGTSHYDRWIVEHEELEQRLAGAKVGKAQESLAAVQNKLAFLRAMQKAKSTSRWRRVSILGGEVAAGRYQRYAHGWKNLVVDLLL